MEETWKKIYTDCQSKLNLTIAEKEAENQELRRKLDACETAAAKTTEPAAKRFKPNKCSDEYIRALGFLTEKDRKTIVDGYFANRIKLTPPGETYHNLATLTWALSRISRLEYSDEDGWTPTAKILLYSETKLNIKRHNSNIIKFLHHVAVDSYWLIRNINTKQKDFNKTDGPVHSAFYALGEIEDAIPETKSTVAPTHFKCMDCHEMIGMEHEQRCVPVELERYLSGKWYDDEDLAVEPVCVACFSKYTDRNGELDIPQECQCGLCARENVGLHNLAKPEPSILDLDVDFDIEVSEYDGDELEWLRGIEHRRNDFWCLNCINHSVGVIGHEALAEMRTERSS